MPRSFFVSFVINYVQQEAHDNPCSNCDLILHFTSTPVSISGCHENWSNPQGCAWSSKVDHETYRQEFAQLPQFLDHLGHDKHFLQVQSARAQQPTDSYSIEFKIMRDLIAWRTIERDRCMHANQTTRFNVIAWERRPPSSWSLGVREVWSKCM